MDRPQGDMIEALARDIAFALTKTGLLPRNHDAGRNDAIRAMAGDVIAKHLVLANWRFERGPPLEDHSTPWPFGGEAGGSTGAPRK